MKKTAAALFAGLIVAALAVLAGQPAAGPSQAGGAQSGAGAPGAGPGTDMPFPLQTLPGFQVELVNSRIRGARFIAAAPNGEILVALISEGRVVAIDPAAPPTAEPRTVLSGLQTPNAPVFHGRDLYVGTYTGIVRIRNYPEGSPEVLVDNLPRHRGHVNRSLAVAADGTMYISVGSSCNVCQESDSRLATIFVFDPGSRQGRIHARGLRNASGMDFDAQGRLWAVVNQRDNLRPEHTDLPGDELVRVQAGGDYGWPWSYPVPGRRLPNPEFPNTDTSRFLPADWLFQAHSAPLQIAFYETGGGASGEFPAEWNNRLFVAFHGSWNRQPPTGYKVIAVQVDAAGRVLGERDFVWGWLDSNGRVRGRPVGVTQGTDGALYISDDTGYLFRVVHRR